MSLITINSLLMGYAGKVSFVYHPELAGYTTSMLIWTSYMQFGVCWTGAGTRLCAYTGTVCRHRRRGRWRNFIWRENEGIDFSIKRADGRSKKIIWIDKEKSGRNWIKGVNNEYIRNNKYRTTNRKFYIYIFLFFNE